MESNDLFEREKASEYAHTLGFWWSSTGIDYFKNYHAKLRAVTRADINRYIKTYIHGKNHVGLALASPEAKRRANLTDQDLIGEDVDEIDLLGHKLRSLDLLYSSLVS